MPPGIYKHKASQGFRKGHKYGNRFSQGNKLGVGNKYNLGRKQSKETIEKRMKNIQGEKHPKWIGSRRLFITLFDLPANVC